MPSAVRLIAACLLLGPMSAVAQRVESAHAATVRAFVDAFNRHESGAMSAFVADDVQWLSISGDSITVDARGKAALVSAMDSYFKSCTTCRSELTALMESRERVSTVEAASWQSSRGARTQSSVAVYEFSGSLIRRVYYFPAEK
jgi:hypothetical protein